MSISALKTTRNILIITFPKVKKGDIFMKLIPYTFLRIRAFFLRRWTTTTDEGFYIKKNYRHRTKPNYFEDTDTVNSKVVWQPDVYRVAERLGINFDSTHIIDIGCGNALKLVKLYPKFKIIGVDFGKNLTECRSNYKFGEWIEHNLEDEGSIKISEDILRKATIVCSDVIEHLVNPTPLLNKLKELMNYAPTCVISTPERDLTRGKNHFGPPENPHHIREWNVDEFEKLLINHGFCLSFIGLTISNNQLYEKKTIIVGIGNKDSIRNNRDKWEDEVASKDTEILKKLYEI